MMRPIVWVGLGSMLMGAGDWTVCADGVAPYATIQDALDAGEKAISICAGTYAPFTLGSVDGVEIVGAGEDEVLVTSTSTAAMTAYRSSFSMSGLTLTGYALVGHGAGFDIHESEATISHVTLRDGRSQGRTVLYGAALDQSDAVLDHVTFVGNMINGAVLEAWDGSIVMRHSIFTDNHPHPYTDKYGVLIDIQDDEDAEITNNVFYDNRAANYRLILFGQDPGHTMNISNNVFWGMYDCAGSVLVDNAAVFSNNIIGREDCSTSISSTVLSSYNLYWTHSGDGGDAADHDIGGFPRFVDSMAGDFSLRRSSPAVDAGDPALSDPDGSRSDIGAFGGPYGTW